MKIIREGVYVWVTPATHHALSDRTYLVDFGVKGPRIWHGIENGFIPIRRVV